MKKAIRLIASALLICGCTGCADKTEKATDTASADALIEQIITYHGCYGAQADEKVNSLLAELKKCDRRQGKLWKNIMEYWKYTETELTVNTDRLPDGLPDDNSLAITVLGFQLNDDGSMQDELLARLQVALTCAEQYPNAYVICTGGGTAMFNPTVTEGDLMGAWMLEHGLDKRRLIVENKSYTTAENASNSYEILLRDYPQVDSVALVSSSYHIAWGSLMFEAAFLKAASEQHTPEIHVISNSACAVENDLFPQNEILRWETGGLLQLVGNNMLASQYYTNFGNIEKPEL